MKVKNSEQKRPTVMQTPPDQASIDREEARRIQHEDEVRRRAYLIYEKRGMKPGSETEDWLKAEAELQGTDGQKAA
jgi:hypothetical protein